VNPVAAPKTPEAPPLQEQPVTGVSALDKDTTLVVGQQTFHFIAHIQRCAAREHQQAEQTVERWELRDATNQVIYHQSYHFDGTCEDTVDVGASAINTKQGSGVLIDGEELPSAPGSGGWWQVFGIHDGKLVPFGPPIGVQGEFTEIATDPRRTPPEIPGRTVIVMSDILKFKIWTGNFNIIYPVLINWIDGKVEPSWRCLRSTSQGRVEQCSYPVQAESRSRKQPTFVRLYNEPDDGFTPKHVIIKPESKIDFLEADAPVQWEQDAGNIEVRVDFSPKVWLKIRVDGQEGWIHTEEDFAAVGLPSAG
jgi:hypothetical protein